jgi:hypothetical protein
MQMPQFGWPLQAVLCEIQGRDGPKRGSIERQICISDYA